MISCHLHNKLIIKCRFYYSPHHSNSIILASIIITLLSLITMKQLMGIHLFILHFFFVISFAATQLQFGKVLYNQSLPPKTQYPI